MWLCSQGAKVSNLGSFDWKLFLSPTSSLTFEVPFTITTIKHVINGLGFLAVFWNVPVLNLYADNAAITAGAKKDVQKVAGMRAQPPFWSCDGRGFLGWILWRFSSNIFRCPVKTSDLKKPITGNLFKCQVKHWINIFPGPFYCACEVECERNDREFGGNTGIYLSTTMSPRTWRSVSGSFQWFHNHALEEIHHSGNFLNRPRSIDKEFLSEQRNRSSQSHLFGR
jgi:hypothetical protein